MFMGIWKKIWFYRKLKLSRNWAVIKMRKIIAFHITFLSFSEASIQLQMYVGYQHPSSRTTQNTLTWPRDHPCPFPLIDYWLEIIRFFPSYRWA
jgi:hypothetical protein